MPLGPKLHRPGDHIFYIGLYRENIIFFLVLAYIGKNIKTIFLSETIRLRALIFGHILA